MLHKVPATSCLVLLLADESTYAGKTARGVFSAVDLSAGQPMVDLLGDGVDRAMEEVRNRKYAVSRFCREYLSEKPDAQVIVLGSGLDPLSIDIAECYPDATVIDVDMANLDIKQKINDSLGGPELRFCVANLADVPSLVSALQAAGWDPQLPTLLVAEGISYYIPKPVFLQTLKALRTAGGALVLEYSMPEEEITDEEALQISSDFYGKLWQLLEMPFQLQRYGTKDAASVARELGGELVQTLTSHEMELGRTGKSEHAPNPTDGVIRVSFIRMSQG